MSAIKKFCLVMFIAALIVCVGRYVTADEGAKININTANAEELLLLKGLGLKKANAVIEYRGEKGSFKKIEDIKNVKGIGDKIFEKIKDKITVGDE